MVYGFLVGTVLVYTVVTKYVLKNVAGTVK
jgi:hypothetical protein